MFVAASIAADSADASAAISVANGNAGMGGNQTGGGGNVQLCL